VDEGHFKTHLKSCAISFSTCSRLELISGILCIVGCIELLVNNGRVIWFYGSIFLYNFTYVAFGQRLAKITMEQELLLFTSYRQ
jgi:hypothetical protein